MKKYKKISNDLLAEYDLRNADNSEFWADHWGNQSIEVALKKSLTGYLGATDFILEELNKEGKILEAGCGKGQIVAALKTRGYKVTGLDFAESTINDIKRFQPDLDVVEGNLKNIPFEDKHFSAYLSFGVIEHFINQSEVKEILDEAIRVTKDRVFISVPYLSKGVRKSFENKKVEEYNGEGNFYQYYFGEKEIEKYLESFGLKPYKKVFYATHIGLKRHHSLYKFMMKFSIFRSVAMKSRRFTDKMLGRKYAHMIGVWCKV